MARRIETPAGDRTGRGIGSRPKHHARSWYGRLHTPEFCPYVTVAACTSWRRRRSKDYSGAGSPEGDVLDVLSLRRGLEVEAARLAAQRHTPEDLARIHAAWNAHPGHVGGFTVEAGMALHLSIVEASHNSALIDVYRGVLAAVTDSLSAVSVGQGFHVDEHRPLIAAIEERNPDEAARAAGAALDTVIDTVERSLA